MVKPQQLLVLIAIVMGFVWFVPGEHHDEIAEMRAKAEAEKPSAPDPWGMDPEPSQSANNAAVAAGGDVVLQRERNGHFYARPMIDSRETHVMIDTGASMIALTGSDASAIGLSWAPEDVRPIARGASGDVYGVPVTLDRVQLGSFQAYDVQAAIVPEGLDVTLLGQSFLSQIDRVEITGDKMILSDR